MMTIMIGLNEVFVKSYGWDRPTASYVVDSKSEVIVSPKWVMKSSTRDILIAWLEIIIAPM